MIDFYKLLLARILLVAVLFNSLNGTQVNFDEAAKSDKAKCTKLFDFDERDAILNNRKDVVLVLGERQSGKSSFVQWLTGDDSKLKALKVSRGKFIIEDRENKFTSGIYLGPDNQTVFYEIRHMILQCPVAHPRSFVNEI